MKDMQAYLQKLHRDAVDYALISKRATDPQKRELFDRLAGHLAMLAAQVEHAIEANVKVGHTMKFIAERPLADPDAAARRLIEIANSVETVQDGRIHIEKINGPFLYREGGSPAEYGAGLKLAIERGWLWMHESGTYVKFTPAGAELFA